MKCECEIRDGVKMELTIVVTTIVVTKPMTNKMLGVAKVQLAY